MLVVDGERFEVADVVPEDVPSEPATAGHLPGSALTVDADDQREAAVDLAGNMLDGVSVLGAAAAEQSETPSQKKVVFAEERSGRPAVWVYDVQGGGSAPVLRRRLAGIRGSAGKLEDLLRFPDGEMFEE